jgi:hypothetical protein
MNRVTHEELKKFFSYDHNSGKFYRLVRMGRVRPGLVESVPAFNGYLYLGIGGKKYLHHRLAWFYVHGYWPSDEVDHIDGDKTNNAISNLRCASRAENEVNKGLKKSNTSGIKGVRWEKHTQKWYAFITVNAKMMSLGRYDSVADAVEARERVAKRIHGEFYRAA